MSEPVEPKQPSRRWRWVLGASLALNLLFVGLIAGAMLRHDGPRGAGKPPPEMRGFGLPYMRALPKENRRALFDTLRDGGYLPRRADRRAAFEEMVAAMRMQPFDASAAEAVLQGQADRLLIAQSAAQTEWLRLVSGMTDAERTAYADRMEERMEERMRRGLRKER